MSFDDSLNYEVILPNPKTLGIIVPTLGDRPETLRKTLESVNALGEHFPTQKYILSPSFARISYEADWENISDSGKGLVTELSNALLRLARTHDLITWIGDDDILYPDALALAANKLLREEKAVAVFANCDYIDIGGQKIGKNRFGLLAAKLLPFGPNLLPQPGSIIRSSSFIQIGGLSKDFKLAFDYKMFLELKKIGPIIYENKTTAAFRWHAESLSVTNRRLSSVESERARIESRGYRIPLVDSLTSWLQRVIGNIVRVIHKLKGRPSQ